MRKRILASMLSLVMVLTMMPAAAWATDPPGGTGGAEDHYPTAGEEFTVTLEGSGTANVTISGYMDEKDWYVMDGLTLMYDGIYNAGMNQHDDAATTWVQLVPDVGGNLTISGQTWTEKGLTVQATGVSQVALEKPIATGNAGMTYEQVFSASNLSDAKGGSGTYFAPFQTLANFGSIRRDGPILNYTNGENSVLSIRPQMESNQLITATLASDGVAQRSAYRDGSCISSATKKQPGDLYTFSTVRIPANHVAPESEGDDFYLNKTLYGLRLYNRALTDEEIAQNAAVDQARFEGNTYKAPGTVQVSGGSQIPLTEYDFHAGATQTTVSSVDFTSGSAGLTLTLNKEGTYTLVFDVGGTKATREITVISAEDAEGADHVISLINALPDSAEVGTADLEDIAEAQAAYDALSAAAKNRVGNTLAAKLDTCLAALDTAMQGQEISVTFDTNNGSFDGEQPTNVTVPYGSNNFTLAVPSRDLYVFAGWYAGETQVTDSLGNAVIEWNYLHATELTAHWTAASQSGEGYTITNAAQIYALARILAQKPTSDSSVTEDLKSDYELFGVTSGYAEGYGTLQKAIYTLGNAISLDDQGGTYYGIPNFAGTFDGDNHTITLAITLPQIVANERIGGLIASFDGGTVKDLVLAGTIQSYQGGTTVTDGLIDIGALAGGYVNNHSATIANVTSSVTMDLTLDTTSATTCVYAGGIIGRIYSNGSMTSCVNTGDLTAAFTGFQANGGCRLGGIAGHIYSETPVTNCRNEGDISTADSDTKTNAGGMAGSGSVIYTNCIQSGDITSNGYRIYAFPGMSEGSTGNTLELTVSGTAGQVVTYGSQSYTLDGTNPVTFSIPVVYSSGTAENNGFSYNEYLTVNGIRLDWYNTTSTIFTANINTNSAMSLDTPFQTWTDALVLTTKEHLVALQKAINEGDSSSIDTLYALGNREKPTNYEEARLILQTAYYKLGENITVDGANFTGIGSSSYPFGGHLDGQGKTVTLIIARNASDGYLGLFGNIDVVGGSEAVLRNLSVVSTITVDSSAATVYAGGLAGRVNADTLHLENVAVTVNRIAATSTSANSSASLQVGGLFGSGSVPADSTVSLTVAGAISGTGTAGSVYAGGAMGNGSVYSPITVTFGSGASVTAKNTGGAAAAGGLTGYFASGSVDLRGSKLVNNTGSPINITSDASNYAYAGGWVGQTTAATSAPDDWLSVDGSTVVTGDFHVAAQSTTGSTANAGGIVGRVGSSFSVLVTDYTNMISVSGKYAGGLFGDLATGKVVTLRNSGNNAKIEGASGCAGGLIAAAGSGIVTVENCWNTGAVSATESNLGGLVGTAGSSTLTIQNSLNTGSVTESGAATYAGGLVGLVGAGAACTLTNSANGGTLAGTNCGGLIGNRVNGSDMTYTNALYLKRTDADKVIGAGVSDADGAIAMDTTKLGTSATFDTPIDLLSADAPAVLSVKGGAAFSGKNLNFTQVGQGIQLTFYWGSRELYEATADVGKKALTTSDVVITGVNSAYPSDAAAAAGMNAIQVYYNGHVLTPGTDYTIAQDSSDHTFQVSFIGNYTGTAKKSYSVTPNALTVTADGYTGTYDGGEYGITVSAPAGATISYSTSDSSYTQTPVQHKDAGTYVVYFQVTLGGESVTGSQIVSIDKATITVTADSKSVVVGGAMPNLTYSVKGLVTGDSWIVAPMISCSADLDTVNSYAINVYGGDAGANYEILYQGGNLTVYQPDSGGDDDHHTSAGGSSTTTYPITVDAGRHGDVTVRPARAERGEKVTITVEPDAGYQLGELIVTDSSGNEISVRSSGNGRYTFTMPRGRVTVEATFIAIEGSGLPFLDVAGNAWYYDAVAYAYENGLMSGTASNLFSPNATTTRGMIVTMLYRLEGEPRVSGTSTFDDVADGMYYADAVIWANANGIVTGYDETTFGPNDAITREQMAAILYRYAQYKAYRTTASADLSGYVDADAVSAYALPALQWASAEGLVTGTSNNTLTPDGSATRAQVATIFMRFMEDIVW